MASFFQFDVSELVHKESIRRRTSDIELLCCMVSCGTWELNCRVLVDGATIWSAHVELLRFWSKVSSRPIESLLLEGAFEFLLGRCLISAVLSWPRILIMNLIVSKFSFLILVWVTGRKRLGYVRSGCGNIVVKRTRF